jgi:hypothetical protein
VYVLQTKLGSHHIICLFDSATQDSPGLQAKETQIRKSHHSNHLIFSAGSLPLDY